MTGRTPAILLVAALLASSCWNTAPAARPGTDMLAAADGFVFRAAGAASHARSADGTVHNGVALARSDKAPADATTLAGTTASLLASPAGASPATTPAATAVVRADGYVRFERVPPGLYRMRLNVDGTIAEFPLTLIPDATVRWGAYPVTRDRAHELVKAALASEISPDRALLFSPQTPLPAGVEVAPALGADDGSRDAFTVPGPRWLVYVDPYIDLRWQHPTKFAFVDTDTGAITMRDGTSWPLLNGGSFYADGGTAYASPDLLAAPPRRAGIAPADARDAAIELAAGVRPALLAPALPDHVPGCAQSFTYALLIQGSDESNQNADVRNIRNLFNKAGLPAAKTFPWKPTAGNSPKAEVQALWAQILAQATECDQIFLYATSHGNRNGDLQLDTDALNSDGEPKQYVGFNLARDLNWTTCKACHITVVLDFCYAGRALSDLAAVFTPLRGRKVIAMSAVDARTQAGAWGWWDARGPTGGMFTHALVDAVTSGGATTLASAFDKASTSIAGNALSSGSIIGITIGSELFRHKTPQYWERKLQPGETCREPAASPSSVTRTSSPTPVTATVPPTSAASTPASAARPTAPTAASAGYRCVGDQMKLYDSSNTALVANGGSPSTFSTNGKPYCLVSVSTYHWNGGRAAIPGRIGLLGGAGDVGPVQTQSGTGVPNADWVYVPDQNARPLLLGEYTCTDSDPSTWSQNQASGGRGFCRVWVQTAEK